MIDDQLLIDRMRRPRPDWAPIVPGSLPVTSFGDPRSARVASVGINPSVHEFWSTTKSAGALPAHEKRFVDTEALGLDPDQVPSIKDAQLALDSCHRYFQVNPYKWFDRMEHHVMNPLRVSYLNGSAVHLDLIQWATDPVWNGIKSKEVRDGLVRDDLPFLRALIGSADFDLIVLNGRTVVETFLQFQIFEAEAPDTIVFGGTRRTTIWHGTVAGIRALGWSLNVPDSHTSNEQRAGLSEWLRHQMRGR